VNTVFFLWMMVMAWKVHRDVNHWHSFLCILRSDVASESRQVMRDYLSLGRHTRARLL
jgi:hypothetical protein